MLVLCGFELDLACTTLALDLGHLSFFLFGVGVADDLKWSLGSELQINVGHLGCFQRQKNPSIPPATN
jgi:hypothetical protein